MEDMDALTRAPAGPSSSSAGAVSAPVPLTGVQIKTEPGAEGPNEHAKTMAALKSNTKTVLRTCGDTIVDLKLMFSKTAGTKYADQLSQDVGKLLPKFTAHYKNIEKLLVSDEGFPEEHYLAISIKLDFDYKTYNELQEWYVRFFPKPKAESKKKCAKLS
eukprot:2299855-Pyramimonas_sp.AAC.1